MYICIQGPLMIGFVSGYIYIYNVYIYIYIVYIVEVP